MICDDEQHIILHAKHSLLYSYGEPWHLFDVIMGRYDGAKSCKLAGVYLLPKIKKIFDSICIFFTYRDDGLGVSKASL